MTDKDGLIGRPVAVPVIKQAHEEIKCSNCARLEAEVTKFKAECGKWNADYNKTYHERCEAHVEIDVLEADLFAAVKRQDKYKALIVEMAEYIARQPHFGEESKCACEGCRLGRKARKEIDG